MSEGKDPADGRPSLRRFGAAFLGLLHGHVELFGIELQEQKANTLRLLLFAGLALVFALLLLVGLSLLVLIVFWDTNRLAAGAFPTANPPCWKPAAAARLTAPATSPAPMASAASMSTN